MAKFKFKLTKITQDGVEEHEVIIKSNEKLDAVAKVEMMFPDYEVHFEECV